MQLEPTTFYNPGLKILERSGGLHFGDAKVGRLSPLQPFPPLSHLLDHRKCLDQRQPGCSRLKVFSACLGWLQAVTRLLRLFSQAEFVSGENNGFVNGRRGLQAQKSPVPTAHFPLVPS